MRNTSGVPNEGVLCQVWNKVGNQFVYQPFRMAIVTLRS